MKNTMLIIVGLFAMLFAMPGFAYEEPTPQEFKDAEKGDARAEREVAYYFENCAHDLDKAELYYKKVAGSALCSLGRIYEKRGDYTQAMNYYQQAADNGFAHAYGCMGNLHAAADKGFAQDMSKAVDLWILACDKGSRSTVSYLIKVAKQEGNSKAVACLNRNQIQYQE